MPGDENKKTPPGAILIAKEEVEDYKAKIATLEAQVASMKKANDEMEKDYKAKIAVFEQQKGNVQNEPATKVQDAKIAKLEKIASAPLIEKMLTAKEISGADDAELKEETARLTAMTFDEVQKEYDGNSKLIARILATKVDETALIAKNEEKQFEFNGGNKGQQLTGKTVSLDQILNEVSSQ